VQGKFNAALPLERYPFDTQDLVVILEDKNKSESELVYAPDDDPISIWIDITIPGWDIGEPTMDVASNEYPTDFGDPLAGEDTYSRAGDVCAGGDSARRDLFAEAAAFDAAGRAHGGARALGPPALR
jgi:hypothetical protein